MLLTRVATALVLLPAVLACLFVLPPLWFSGLLLLFGAAGAWEWSRLAGLTAVLPRIGLTLLVGVLCAAGLILPDLANVLVGLACAWWVLALLVLAGERIPPARRLFAASASQILLGMLVLPATVAALQQLFTGGSRPWLVVSVFVIVWAADIGAYFAGRAFGRRPLAPQISPRKTWEGALGGALAALLVGTPLLCWASATSVPQALLVVPVLIVAAVVGDLIESVQKRQAGVKDSGALLPGHGGVLDRVDSMLAAAPLMAAYVALAGV